MFNCAWIVATFPKNRSNSRSEQSKQHSERDQSRHIANKEYKNNCMMVDFDKVLKLLDNEAERLKNTMNERGNIPTMEGRLREVYQIKNFYMKDSLTTH